MQCPRFAVLLTRPHWWQSTYIRPASFFINTCDARSICNTTSNLHKPSLLSSAFLIDRVTRETLWDDTHKGIQALVRLWFLHVNWSLDLEFDGQNQITQPRLRKPPNKLKNLKFKTPIGLHVFRDLSVYELALQSTFQPTSDPDSASRRLRPRVYTGWRGLSMTRN